MIAYLTIHFICTLICFGEFVFSDEIDELTILDFLIMTVLSPIVVLSFLIAQSSKTIVYKKRK